MHSSGVVYFYSVFSVVSYLLDIDLELANSSPENSGQHRGGYAFFCKHAVLPYAKHRDFDATLVAVKSTHLNVSV